MNAIRITSSLFGKGVGMCCKRILIVFIVLVVLTGCSPEYSPSPNAAFSVATNYADDELATAHPEPIMNPGCNHRPEWVQVSVEDRGNSRYKVHGRVFVGNVYCVKDVSDFSATVYYDFDIEKWRLIGDVSFSNECVLYKTYRSIPDHCFISELDK